MMFVRSAICPWAAEKCRIVRPGEGTHWNGVDTAGLVMDTARSKISGIRSAYRRLHVPDRAEMSEMSRCVATQRISSGRRSGR